MVEADLDAGKPVATIHGVKVDEFIEVHSLMLRGSWPGIRCLAMAI